MNREITPRIIRCSLILYLYGLNTNGFDSNDMARFANTENATQTSGTAMGTKMAPTYATLALGYLDERLYNHAEKEGWL